MAALAVKQMTISSASVRKVTLGKLAKVCDKNYRPLMGQKLAPIVR